MRSMHQLLDADGLLGGCLHLLVDPEVVLGVDDHTVKPVNDAELPTSAKNANIRTIDFGQHFGDFVFHEAIQVGRTVRRIVHIHRKIPPASKSLSPSLCALSGCEHKTQNSHNSQYFDAVKTRNSRAVPLSGTVLWHKTHSYLGKSSGFAA